MTRVISGAVSVSASGVIVTAWSGVTLTSLNCVPDSPVVIEGRANFVKQRLSNNSFELHLPHSGPGGTGLAAGISSITPVEAQVSTLNARTAQVIQELDTLDANGRGLFYNVIGVTGDNDPGPGNLAFNNSDPEAVTELYFDVLDANDGGRSVVGILELMPTGTLLIVRSLASNAYMSFQTTSPMSGTTYKKVTVSYVEHDGSVSSEPVSVEYLMPGKDKDVDAYSANMAGLAAYSGQPEGYVVMVADDGTGRSGRYVHSSPPGTWTLGGYWTGPMGESPDLTFSTVVVAPGVDPSVVPTPITDGYNLEFRLPAARVPGYPLRFSTTTTDADPGAGLLRANNATLGSATSLFISKTAQGGAAIAAFLLSLDDSTNTIRGTLELKRVSDGQSVTWSVGVVTDATNYVKVAVSGMSGLTALANNVDLVLTFFRAGDKGTNGAGAIADVDAGLGISVDKTNPAEPVVNLNANLTDLLDVDLTGAADGDGLKRQGGVWVPGAAGGGMFRGNLGTVGSRKGDIFRVNAKIVTEDVTIAADENASAAGPLSVESGNVLSIASGGNLVIL